MFIISSVIVFLLSADGCSTLDPHEGSGGSAQQPPAGSGEITLSLPEPDGPVMEVVVNPGDEFITELAVTSDGRFAATCSDANAVKIWDVERRTLVRTLDAPDGAESVLISRDDSYVIVNSRDGAIRIYHLATGTLMKEYRDIGYGTIVFGRRPDEILMAVEQYEFSGVYAVDLEEGTREIVLDGTGHRCSEFTFSGDRRFAASDWNLENPSPRGDNAVVVWDLEEGEVIETWYPSSKFVYNIAFSPDMRYIAASDNDSKVMIWDRTIDYEFPNDDWTEDFGRVHGIRFSNDGRLLVFSGDDIEIYDTVPEEELPAPHLWERSLMSSVSYLPSSVMNVVCLPEKQELIATAGNSICRIDMSDRTYKGEVRSELLYTFGGNAWAGGLKNYRFSPETGTLLVPGEYGYTLWDLEEGLKRGAPRFPLDEEWYGYDVFHGPSSTVLTQLHDNHEIAYWHAETGEVIARLSGGDAYLDDPVFSPDGSRAFYVREPGVIQCVDLPSGELVREYRGKEEDASELVLARDGTRILSESAKNEYLQVWDVESGEKVYDGELYNNSDFITFSPVDDTLFIAFHDKLYRFDYTNGTDDLSSSSDICVTREYRGHTNGIEYIGFSSDGSRMLSCSYDETVIVWDTETGEIIHRLRHPSAVESAAFSGDELWLYTCTKNGLIRQYDAETGRLVSSSISGPGRESVVWTPDGYFAGQGEMANDAVFLVKGLETYAIDQFAMFRNRPDIILKRRGSDNTALMEEYFNHYLKRLISYELLPESIPAVRWEEIIRGTGPSEKQLLGNVYNNGTLRSGYADQTDIPLSTRYRLLKIPAYLDYLETVMDGGLHSPEADVTEFTRTTAEGEPDRYEGTHVKIDFSLRDSLYDLRSYNIFINGVPLYGLQGKDIEQGHNSISLTETVELSRGENRIEVSCYNELMAESLRRPVIVENLEETGPGDLYFIGFGVSEYSSDDVADLRYADDDISDLEDLFASLDGRYDEVHTHAFLNDEVTPGAIRDAKNLIADAGPHDTFVVAAAGHGIHDDDPDSTYYFLTADAQLDNLSETAAEFSWIEDLLTGETPSAPRNKLLLLDTCQSGDFAPWMDTSALTSAGASRGVHARSIIPREENGIARGLRRREPRRTWVIDDGRYILNSLNRSSGAVVFSSCKGDQFSFENETLENGYFTASFIDVFQQSIADGEEVLDLREVISRVTEMVKERMPEQTPTVDRDNMHLNFVFPLR